LTEAQLEAGHLVGIVCDSTTGGAFEERLSEDMKDKLALGIHRTPMQCHVGPGDAASIWRTYRIIRNCGGTYCTGMAPRVAPVPVCSAHCCGYQGLA
jgi:hypothetical protein